MVQQMVEAMDIYAYSTPLFLACKQAMYYRVLHHDGQERLPALSLDATAKANVYNKMRDLELYKETGAGDNDKDRLERFRCYQRSVPIMGCRTFANVFRKNSFLRANIRLVKDLLCTGREYKKLRRSRF